MLGRRPAFIAIFLLPFVLSACGDAATSDPRILPPLVRTAIVQNASISSRSFTGIVAARVQSDLGFRVSGKVLERLVDSGQSVKHNQPLMRMDPVDLALQAQAQQEAVVAARARAKQTTNDEVRYRALVAGGVVSVSAYDQIKAAADTARAQLNAAEAQANVAKNASNYAVLLADSDGVVMDTLAEPGQVVSAGQAVVRLARAGQREAIVHLPETLRPAVGSQAKAALYGKYDPPIPVTLRQLSDAADPVTRTFEARYVLEGALASAPLGATVTIQIPDNTLATHSAVQVPISALFDPGKGQGVWVVDGKPHQVTWHAVRVLSLTDDTAVVAGNLEVGEQIVSLGAHLLQEGQQVRPIDQQNAMVTGGRP